MPVSGKVALVDTQAFEVTHEIEAGEQPMRVELQSDQRYLWVGNSTTDAATSGVTVIDTADLEPVAFIPTGPGHHEIASPTTIATPSSPIATAAPSPSSTSRRWRRSRTSRRAAARCRSPSRRSAGHLRHRRRYRRDHSHRPGQARDPWQYQGRAGYRPAALHADGRWGMVVNTSTDKVFVLDASTNQLPHSIEVGDAALPGQFHEQLCLRPLAGHAGRRR